MTELHVRYTRMYRCSQKVFASEYSSNNILTWALRVLGMFLVFIGFNMVTGILVTLGTYVCVHAYWSVCIILYILSPQVLFHTTLVVYMNIFTSNSSEFKSMHPKHNYITI